MSETVKIISQRRYNEMKRTIIMDSIDFVLNTIASQTLLKKKDKTYTSKKLKNTIELLYKLLGDMNNDNFPSDIINSLKPHITTKLRNTFCVKLRNININNRYILDQTPIIFSPYIQLALEIPYKEIKKDVKLKKSPELYRFFVFPLNIDKKEYIIIYAEENKYSKREIIEISYYNYEINRNILPEEIKTKYNFL